MPATPQRKEASGVLLESGFVATLVILASLSFVFGVWHSSTQATPQPDLSLESAVQTSSPPITYFLDDSVTRIAERSHSATEGSNTTSKVKDAPKLKTTHSEKSKLRRDAMRNSFLPALADLPGSQFQFVIRNSAESHENSAIKAEESEYPGTFLQLNTTDSEDCSSGCASATLEFVQFVHRNFDAEWILKLDDDVYLAPARLLAATSQWNSIGAEYVGCMNHGLPTAGAQGGAVGGRSGASQSTASAAVEVSQQLRGANSGGLPVGVPWLMNPHDTMHATPSVYALSRHVVSRMLKPNSHLLRDSGEEGASVGLWMLAFNVTFFEDLRLCTPKCHIDAVAFISYSCASDENCDWSAHIEDLHSNFKCSSGPESNSSLHFLPPWPSHKLRMPG